MKKVFYLVFFFFLFLSLQVDANVVTVKGYVKLANGTAVANTEVKIAIYLAAATTSCSEQTVVTNSAGFYSKELSCTGDIRRSRITVKNCDGTTIVQEKEVPLSKILEANFSVCQAKTAACYAKFTAESLTVSSTVPAYSVRFNSSSSEVGSGDDIIHRTWDFHDGTPLLNDRIDPLHTFPHAGTYEVCMTIKTALGCESKICKQVVLQPVSPPTCAAKFTAEFVPASSTVPAMSERFNSSSSEIGVGDRIEHRTWDFHDGTPLLVDRVDPLHTFPHAGTYEVCLTIKTALGCESKICKQIVLQPVTVVACSAKFTFEKLGPKKFRFNSTLSNIDATDKIIERRWDFRDGTSSNDISPAHEFAKSGNYEVCLSIKTAKGCESRACSLVKVEEITSTDVALVQIVSVYPTPAHESLKIVVLSKRNNINATVAIVNADGVVLKSKKTTLIEGYNPLELEVNRLAPGSYFIKVTTQYGVVSKPFYKL